MREEPLTGGRNASEVVRVGDTVRRAPEPGSAFAASLLGYLEASGYPYAPRYLGVDERGRDILTYIPGRTTDHPGRRAWADEAIRWATADQELIRAHEQTLLTALR